MRAAAGEAARQISESSAAATAMAVAHARRARGRARHLPIECSSSVLLRFAARGIYGLLPARILTTAAVRRRYVGAGLGALASGPELSLCRR